MYVGNIIFTKTEPFSVLSAEEVRGPFADNAMAVIASSFIFESKMCIVPLIRIIAETIKCLRLDMPTLRDNVNDIDDEDEDGSTTGQDQPPIRSFSKLSSKAVTTSSMAVNSKTEDKSSKKSSTGKGGGGGEGGKGKRRSLGTLEHNIMLSAEALYHHNKPKFNVW